MKYRGFLKWWIPKTSGFNTKMVNDLDNLGVPPASIYPNQDAKQQ